MKFPNWLYQFSFKREPIWILVFSLIVPLIGVLAAVIIPWLTR